MQPFDTKPAFFGDKLWESLTDFLHHQNNTAKVEKLIKRINKLLLGLYRRIRVLTLRLDLVKGNEMVEQLQQILREVEMEQSDIEKDEEEIIKIYDEYVRERRLEIDSLLVTMARIVSERELLEDELPPSFLRNGDPLHERMDHFLEYMDITQNYVSHLNERFPSFSSLYKPVFLVTEEEKVEEIIVERNEVETGMTQEQQDVFDYLEDLIVERETTKSGCDFVAATYLKRCDVIIHLNLFSFLVAVVTKRDPYLRNVFETGTSLGSDLTDIESRIREEHTLFQSEAYDSFSPHDKVKYGTINWSYTRTGCNQLQGQFGKSYLILSPKVKKRCTYSRYDSVYTGGVKPYQLGTQRTRMCHISKEFTKREIGYMYQSDGRENLLMNNIEEYMEIQIHGELLFERDVTRIMIGPNYGRQIYIEPLLRAYFKIIGKEIPYEFI